MVSVSASVNLPLHHEVQKFSSCTGSPKWSRKKGRKTVVVVTYLDTHSLTYSHRAQSKERNVRHCQNEEASILWSHREETRELPGERNNARNNARCTQARKTTHGLDRQLQVVDRTLCGRVNQNDRIEINGESTSMVWPTLGSRKAKEQNRAHTGRNDNNGDDSGNANNKQPAD